METELWPSLFIQCARGGIPVILANARLSAKSVARYRRFGNLFSSLFTGNVLIAAQSPDDARRFESIGAAAANIRNIGNVKYDVEVDAAALDRGHQLRAAYGAGRPVWIAGSTHAGEEEQVLDAHALLLAERPDALLLLAPRHKDRFAAAADAVARRGLGFVRRSSGITPAASEPVLLVDTLGELQALYGAADIAFVGGSLVPIGGHNLLEPAALGLPVLTGPHHFNSKDIAELLLERGAALEVADAQALAARLRALFGDGAQRRRMGQIGQAIVDANRGSVARLLALMEARLTEARVEPRPAANRSTAR
jgi:3-deoxy-D-manno-octulosonic-acid transferase